jgi:hypothetical protein
VLVLIAVAAMVHVSAARADGVGEEGPWLEGANDESGAPLADAGADGAGAKSEPPPSVALSGPIACGLASAGEATVIWRHGRSSKGVVDETTVRLRVAGGGAASERLSFGFSVGMLLPSLQAGTYASSRAISTVAAVWARSNRATPRPDIEWGSDSEDARARGPVTVTLASAARTAQSSERQGDVTVDTTTYAVHGSLHATVPCARSVTDLHGICTPLTLGGTF